MTDGEINNRITTLLDSIRNDERMPAMTIVQNIVAGYGEPEGAAADFYTCCAYGHVRALVRAKLQKMKRAEDEEGADTQLLLPGFERLQLRYIVPDGDGYTVVPLELMTAEDIRAKANEMRRMSSGCLKHADELIRYLAMREQSENVMAA